MTATEQIRVVLVDDQPLLREGIATILDAQPGISVVGQAASGAEALELLGSTTADVVCMDVEMPGMNGLEATRQLVAAGDGPQVLILTTFGRDDYLVEALDAGASGFILKTTRPEQLADAIRSVAAGDALLSPEVTRSVIERAVAGGQLPDTTAVPEQGQGAGPAASPTAVTDLTDREREVLALVARGLSNDEIAAELVIGRATVKTHVSNVLMKLDLRDRVQAVAFAYRNGLAGSD